MQTRELLDKLSEILTPPGGEEARHEAKMILAQLYDCSLNGVFLQEAASKEQAEKALAMAARRREGYPLQYILGEAWFMGRRFRVSPAVLIPRADSEPMTEEIIRLLQGRAPLLIADICCGSGAIGIALAAALPQARVIGTDISAAALATARENGRELPNIEFIKGDLCEPLRLRGVRPQLIVANPPYVTRAEMQELQAEVRFEPELALYGSEDGLHFYRRLALEAPPLLSAGGILALEIGCAQKESVCSLLEIRGLRIMQCLKDLGGRDRSIFAVKA